MKTARNALWIIGALFVLAGIFWVAVKATDAKFQAHANVQLEKDQYKCQKQGKSLQIETVDKGVARTVCK